MKTLIFFACLFCIIASPGRAALTDADLDKIRLIVKEEVKTEVESSEKRMKTYIDTKIDGVNNRIDGVNTKIDAVEKRLDEKIDGVEKRLGTRIDAVNNRIDSVEKQMTFLLNVIYGLIALIIVAIGIPQVIIGWRSKGDREQQKINQELREEIEALKQQQIARP